MNKDEEAEVFVSDLANIKFVLERAGIVFRCVELSGEGVEGGKFPETTYRLEIPYASSWRRLSGWSPPEGPANLGHADSSLGFDADGNLLWVGAWEG
jgi:hypothetical protein